MKLAEKLCEQTSEQSLASTKTVLIANLQNMSLEDGLDYCCRRKCKSQKK